MEEKTIQGKIEWISQEPKEFNGQLSIGIKIAGIFYNKYSPEEELKTFIKTLKKGFEVKLTIVEGNAIKSLEVISDVVEEKGKFTDDMTSFEDLLNDAHKKFEAGFSVRTELIQNDWENQRAIFKASITTEGSTYQAYGDATQDNCGDLVKKHYIRMAETRAIARALRWATNNAKAASEETESGDLPDQEPEEEEMAQPKLRRIS